MFGVLMVRSMHRIALISANDWSRSSSFSGFSSRADQHIAEAVTLHMRRRLEVHHQQAITPEFCINPVYYILKPSGPTSRLHLRQKVLRPQFNPFPRASGGHI